MIGPLILGLSLCVASVEAPNGWKGMTDQTYSGYPLYAIIHKLEGTSTVELKSAADGEPIGCVLKKSSGATILDDFAIENAYFVPIKGSGAIKFTQLPFIFRLHKPLFDPFTVKPGTMPLPEYPPGLVERAGGGKLILGVVPDENGFIKYVRVISSSGSDQMDAITARTAYSWRMDLRRQQLKAGRMSQWPVVFQRSTNHI